MSTTLRYVVKKNPAASTRSIGGNLIRLHGDCGLVMEMSSIGIQDALFRIDFKARNLKGIEHKYRA